MNGLLLVMSSVSAVVWVAILLLPWRPWSTRERLAAASSAADVTHTDVTVVIPARNEAPVIGRTLAGLAAQGPQLRVIVIDDQSEDDTAERARSVPGLAVTVLEGQPLPAGWSGKLWALEQGVVNLDTRLLLLLDADIELRPGILTALKQQHARGYALVSIMACLRMSSFWEKLLLPAFIHFFKQLYPFALANSANRHVAAAAGGCILIETDVLRELGGLRCIRDALIDDCAMARQVKALGYRTWVGLSHDVVSLRPYSDLAEIWNMVARTAFTQLHYSLALLALTSVVLISLYWVPLAALVIPAKFSMLAGGVAYAVMVGTYLPTLRYYRLSPAWGLLLPVTSTLFLAMTWHSAIRYARGERSRWKGRVYH